MFASFFAFAGFLTSGPVSNVLSFIAITNVTLAITNLVPFIQLDGYFALAAFLDRPNLRRDAYLALRKMAVPDDRKVGLALFGLFSLGIAGVATALGLAETLSAFRVWGVLPAVLTLVVAMILPLYSFLRETR